jgi:hypothetical protein
MCVQFWCPPPCNYLAVAVHYCMAANAQGQGTKEVSGVRAQPKSKNCLRRSLTGDKVVVRY